MLNDVEQQINSAGEIGSMERLEKIASLNLGVRSDAAKRCIEKRLWRKEWSGRGIPREVVNIACIKYFKV